MSRCAQKVRTFLTHTYNILIHYIYFDLFFCHSYFSCSSSFSAYFPLPAVCFIFHLNMLLCLSLYSSSYSYSSFPCHFPKPFSLLNLQNVFIPQLQECGSARVQPSILPTASDSPCWDPVVVAPAYPCPRVSPPTTLQGEPHFHWPAATIQCKAPFLSLRYIFIDCTLPDSDRGRLFH